MCKNKHAVVLWYRLLLLLLHTARAATANQLLTCWATTTTTTQTQNQIDTTKQTNKQTRYHYRHTYNFKGQNGILFMCLAEEEFGRQMPFTFLEDVSKIFFQQYASPQARSATSPGAYKQFQAVLTQKILQYSSQMDTVTKIQRSLNVRVFFVWGDEQQQQQQQQQQIRRWCRSAD
jgi:hypothetical protein